MGVRRQIYISEGEDRLLEEHSKNTGLSVSELVRRAIHQNYGTTPRLSWDEVFSFKVGVGSAAGQGWTDDRLFDDQYVDEAVREAGLDP